MLGAIDEANRIGRADDRDQLHAGFGPGAQGEDRDHAADGPGSHRGIDTA